MKSIMVPVGLLAGLGLLTACGSSDEAPPPVKIEVDTWWTGPAELSAINALVDVHKKTHPDVTINVKSSATSNDLVDEIKARLAAGNPPAAFQANLGGNALQWGGGAQAVNTS